MTSFSAFEISENSTSLLENSLRLLEFSVVREKLAGYTSFSLAVELAMGLAPSHDVTQVSQMQQETAEARRFLDTGSSLDISEAEDLRQVFERAALGGVLSGEELRDVRDTLQAIRTARVEVIRQKDIPILGAIAHGLIALRDLEKDIDAAIGQSGEVLDSASPTLKGLRSETRLAYQQLMDSLERTVKRMERHNVLQEPIITQRNGRMVVLVKAEMKHRLPGIVHDVSDSGATLFIEPMAAIGQGNQWRELRMAEQREEERVLGSLSAKIEVHSNDLLDSLSALAHLDLAMAKARYARAISAVAPNIIEGEGQYMELTDARHPLLGKDVVPITIKVGDEWSLLLITGPNAGGKTVALKTLGLLTLMAHSGLQIPANQATFTIFDGVYTDIGDQQSIQRSLSTFSSHIDNLKAILGQVTDRSLVLIDELGTSTDPEEGTALAKALLNHFVQRGVSVVATTHHRDVAAFVQEQPGMMNASVELDPHTLAPIYRLTLGLPGSSYALTIASRLGLEEGIIDEAKSLLSPAYQTAESLLKELQRERYLAMEQRKAAELALEEEEGKGKELEEELAAIEDRKTELVEEARHQLQLRVDEVMRRLRESERLVEQPVVVKQVVSEPAVEEPAPAPVVEVARKEIAQIRQELRSPEWQSPASRRSEWLNRIKSGDRVYLRGMPRPVEVIAPPDETGTIQVLLGTMRARMPIYQLDRPAQAHTTTSREGIYYSRPAKKQVMRELDLRGARVEEALERVEEFLNDAVVAGLPSVRIAHGVGTGALRNAIREYLQGHPLVKSAGRDETTTSDGATVVMLA